MFKIPYLKSVVVVAAEGQNRAGRLQGRAQGRRRGRRSWRVGHGRPCAAPVHRPICTRPFPAELGALGRPRTWARQLCYMNSSYVTMMPSHRHLDLLQAADKLAAIVSAAMAAQRLARRTRYEWLIRAVAGVPSDVTGISMGHLLVEERPKRPGINMWTCRGLAVAWSRGRLQGTTMQVTRSMVRRTPPRACVACMCMRLASGLLGARYVTRLSLDHEDRDPSALAPDPLAEPPSVRPGFTCSPSSARCARTAKSAIATGCGLQPRPKPCLAAACVSRRGPPPDAHITARQQGGQQQQ